MTIVTVHEAKTNLSKLIARALSGEEIVIARRNVPTVKLVAVPVKQPKRMPGRLKGLIDVPGSFFDPLPDDELALWNGEGD